MASKNSYLRRLEALHHLGFDMSLEAGVTVARGFADLGFEEFTLVRSDWMVSLYTGKGASITDEDRIHLFRVLTCDELLQEISKDGYDVAKLFYHEQREWRLTLQHADKASLLEVCAGTLQEVLLEGFFEMTRAKISREE